MNKTMDELIAEMPPFLQDSFARFNTPQSDGAPKATNQSNGGALANLDADEEPRPAAQAETPYAGRITPSIYAEKGTSLAVWNVNGSVEVMIRDGNGFQHYGRMSPVLVAEGGFGAPSDLEDRAFQRRVFEFVVGPERTQWVNKKGELTDPSNFNYAKRATCLWTNRDCSGSPHPRAFLVLTWKGKGRSTFPTDAILFDGDKERVFQLQREQAGGDRPQWKGYAR